uniref:Agmatinase, mitochondrial-like n=1 Tax=Saccoglossus kowalevskii TaxID=10224 RepID=A0ABM0M8F7_SACKO
LDVCFVGIPLDIGTSFRSGTRHGPRQIRNESSIIGAFNCSTGAAPFESLQIADIGDINLNLYDLKQACNDIREFYRTKVLPYNCVPLTMGGDHTLSYPVLQAIKEKHGAVGMVHIDAHPDTLGTMMGKDVAHGTPFLRSVEEGLLDCNKVITIGLRGHAALPGGDWKVPGFRYVYAQDCWYKSLAPLMEDVRQQMGDTPVYISFDIDALDPAYAPGTVLQFRKGVWENKNTKKWGSGGRVKNTRQPGKQNTEADWESSATRWRYILVATLQQR